MDIVPVANQRQDQQQKGDEQQPGRFRGVDRVAVLLRGSVVLASGVGHEVIVAPGLGLRC